MKKKLSFILAALLLLAMTSVLFGGCGNSSGSADPEIAMQNFLDKVESGNYVISSKGYLKTTVYSEDLVYFDFEDDSVYTDFAVMSVDNEVFQGALTDGGVEEVAFVGEGKAIEAAKGKLPSCWLELSDGNIFNLFYNDIEKPLQFVSYEDSIKNQVRSFAGYGEVAVKYMHEVYLTLDKEDPSKAHITAVMDDDEVARYYFDDIDITITFGKAETDKRAEAWMNDPVYPEARTEWEYADIFIFNSVFLPGYGEEAVPFVPSASYALSIDEERFITDDTVYIRDPHAEEGDVDAYIAVLEENGFEKFTEDGETWYRRLLRDETKCYSSISAEYDNGLNIIAKKYYDFPMYEGFDQINSLIVSNNFPELPDTGVIRDLTAKDAKNEQTESWLYFYDYDIALYVYAHYDDRDKVMEYIDGYAEGLLKDGYVPEYIDGDEESGADNYHSEDGDMSFRYHFEDDGETVILLFKAEKCLTASEVKAILANEGFPETDLSKYETGRDHKKFEKVMYGKDYDSSISISMKFDTQKEAEEYLDKFVADLEDAGFMRVPPSDLGSRKNNGYTNEETRLGVAFDFIPAEDGGETSIYFDFKSGIDFEAEENEEEEDNKPILGSKHVEEIEALIDGQN